MNARIAEILRRESVDVVHFHGVDFHRYLPQASPPAGNWGVGRFDTLMVTECGMFVTISLSGLQAMQIGPLRRRKTACAMRRDGPGAESCEARLLCYNVRQRLGHLGVGVAGILTQKVP